ncbi:MAG: phosphomannose isomerase type II C-terminal cupin domain [Candidatus Omnitrophota bacterium]
MELSNGPVEHPPWGQYKKLFQESGVWVKRVEVNTGARLSLQKHARRSEKWIVVSGQGLVHLNDSEITVAPGSVVDVPVGYAHRIANIGKVPLIFIEVACGEYLGEDDIVRLQDDYRR